MTLNIDKLINSLKEEDYAFDMSVWNQPQGFCGTVACIGGTADLLMRAEDPLNMPKSEDTLRDWILEGLQVYYNPNLFYPTTATACYMAKPGDPRHISRARAVAALENLRDTGELNW